MPLFNVNFPRSELNFMNYLNKIVSFNKYDPNDFIETGFTDTPPLHANFEWLQYNTSNFYQNLGSIILLFAILLGRQLLAPIFYIFSAFRCCRCLKRQ